MKRGRKKALTIALIIWIALLIATFYYLFNVYSSITQEIPKTTVYSHQMIKADGTPQDMEIGDIVSLEIENNDYSFKLYKIENQEAEYVVNDFLYFGLGVGTEKKLDLNGDRTYDLLLQITSLTDKKATIKFTKISEKQSIGADVIEVVDRFEKNSRLQTNFLILLALIVSLVLLFIIIKVYIMPKVEEKRKLSRKSELETFYDLYYKFEEFKELKEKDKAKKLYKRIEHLYNYMSDDDKKRVKSKFNSMTRYLK